MLPTDKITGKLAMQLITNISLRTANKKIAFCRLAIGLDKQKILTVQMFREYYGI